MQWLDGISEIVAKYDVFILDQYGVLHNGVEAFDAAITCFNRLAEKKPILILSNTSRRAVSVAPKLAHLGFDSDKLIGSVTGGEEAWRWLQSNKHLRKCSLITHRFAEQAFDKRKDFESIFYGFPSSQLDVVPISQADFLLVEGSGTIMYSPEVSEKTEIDFIDTGDPNCNEVLSYLKQGKDENLLLLCTNPDLISCGAEGRICHMGGQIAKMYEEMGGKVLYFGKPEKACFETCIQLAKQRVPNTSSKPLRIAHVGDSLYHDILGAQRSGIDSIFITSGIHRKELAQSSKASSDMSQLESVCCRFGIRPTYILQHFRW
uniref:Uncharacterized protein AlNc14C95G5835 n=1 Tax=Albugo laibachii Nc14 TaxID=890382 RepID=F0WGV9_9STRA|nr:conserved hypothetical protein [Albugo laibachii Nc14]|eukprot:CCA20474.1 conserved hypothetical protein [Albugo laibachii Nc14]